MAETPCRLLMIAIGNPSIFALHLLAFARCYPQDEYHLLMIGPAETGTEIIRSVGEAMGVASVTLEEACSNDFDAVLVHSYAHGDSLTNLLDSLTFHEVWFYGDALRDEFVFEPGTDLSNSTLVYFGWELVDSVLLAELGAPPRNLRVVPIHEVGAIWQLVEKAADVGSEVVAPVGPGDFLLILRYWGVPPLYPTRRHDTLVQAIVDLGIPDGVTRVIVKPDWRAVLDTDELIGLLAERFGDSVEVVAWEEHPVFAERLGSLNVLDFHLFRGEWITGHLSGFDGTPNVLVAITQPAARIHWPPLDKLNDYFYRPEVTAAVKETVAMQHYLISQFRAHGAEGLRIDYDGRAFRTMLRDRLPVDSPDRAVVAGALVRIASTVGLGADADVNDISLRVDGLRRDRIRYDRAWHDEARLTTELRSAVLDERAATERVDAANVALNADVVALTADLRDERSKRQEQASLLLRVEEERESFRAERDATAAELRVAVDKVAALEQTINEIHRSRSWKITAPLRRLTSRYRR